MCDCYEFIAVRIWENAGVNFPAKGLKGARHCEGAVAGDSWGLYFQLYYLNCPGKYVQRLYYQFMAPLATPLIQQLKHCNQ